MINCIAGHRRGWRSVVSGWACLFLLLAHVQAGEAPEAEESDSTAAGPKDVQPAGDNSDNIIDRVFSPLDKAVTDINRDINAGNDNFAGESDD
jgi:hypothetical protein